ncbi:MAG: hypothetical protein QXJ69_05155 [Desulfurococcaceae archaeon]
MSSEASSSYLGKLLVLKELDSIIDFARASNQLALILRLYTSGKPMSTDELARDLVDTKKSILDSIRKLERKNLVLKVENNGKLYVELSEEGRRFVSRLLELIKPTYSEDSNVLDVPVRLNIVKEIIVSFNVLRLLVRIGLVPPYSMRIEDARRYVGDSRVFEVIVESFTRNPTRLFRIVSSNGVQVISLDKAGVDLLKKTPYHQAYSSNVLYRLMVKLYRTPLISELTIRLNTSFSLITAILATSAVFVNTYFVAPALVVLIMQLGLNFFLSKLLVVRA